MNDKNFRRDLTDSLTKAVAHVTVKEALEDLDPKNRNIRLPGIDHSIWEELEHIRIAQEDIVTYTLGENYKEIKWPDDYWPKNNDELTDELWNKTLKDFFSDIDKITELINNYNIDLTSEIPHGEGRTYLREILLIIDHNSYHLGKILLIRKKLNDWKS